MGNLKIASDFIDFAMNLERLNIREVVACVLWGRLWGLATFGLIISNVLWVC